MMQLMMDAPTCANTPISLNVAFLQGRGQSRYSVLNYKDKNQIQNRNKGGGGRERKVKKNFNINLKNRGLSQVRENNVPFNKE